MTRPRRMLHELRYRRTRFGTTATCRCGWVSENHPSRGTALRAFEGHLWLAAHRGVYGPVGVDAHRKATPAGGE